MHKESMRAGAGGLVIRQIRLLSRDSYREEGCDLNTCILTWSQGGFGSKRMLVLLGTARRLLLVCPVLPVE